jgi:hypothetical protein
MDNQSNRDGFLNGTLSQIRFPLTWNPCHLKYVLVFGRRAQYENNDQRRSYIRSLEREDFKIISFDSLIEGLRAKEELYVATRKNEYIEIHSTKFIDTTMFVWMPPETLRISRALRADVVRNAEWFRTHVMFNLAKTLPKIRQIRSID